MEPDAMFFVIVAVLVGVVMMLLWSSLSALKRRRLLEDLPTSKTAGVFIGLVELKGTAESEKPLTSRIAEKNCVLYRWSIQEHWSRTDLVTYRDSDGKTRTRSETKSGWQEVASGGETKPFYLKDDHGVIRIDPSGAEIYQTDIFAQQVSRSSPLYFGKGPSGAISHSTGRRNFTETAIVLHQPIYVVGQARERKDIVAAELAHHQSAPIFLISTSTEESHRASGLWKFWSLGVLGVLIPLGIGCFVVQQETDPNIVFGIPFVLGGGVAAIWLTGWFWLVYNSVIGLKNRLKMAAANIDIELKRRFDLIPRLLTVIDGLKNYERNVQETAALLRSQSTIQTVEEGQTAKGCAGRLVVLLENYPDLKANELFMNLHKNLVETEQRIALARNYYNDVIETYNNRRERFPENIASFLAGLKPVPPFIAEDFEQAPVVVKLAD